MRHFLPGLLLALSSAASAHAITLDWNTVNWTPTGSFDESFNVDGSNAGDDIRIRIIGNQGSFETDTSPNDSTDYNGGFGDGQESLVLRVNYPANNDYTTVQMDFEYTGGVHSVSFAVFDVDYNSGQFRDILSNFVAYDANGNAIAVYATLANDATVSQNGNNFNPYNTISNSGTASAQALANNNGNVGQDDDEGNVYVSFASDLEIHAISFRYGNSGLNGDQAIAIGDISWAAVPEPSTVLGGLLLGILGVCHACRRLFPRFFPRLS